MERSFFAQVLDVFEGVVADMRGDLHSYAHRRGLKVWFDDANRERSRFEQVKRFVIVPTPWEPGGDELTPTMKLRRNPITAKYASEIVALYADSVEDGVVDMR